MKALAATLALIALGGCAASGDIRQPIPTQHVAAPQTAQRLVVVLPGRADDLVALQRSGIAAAIQSAWPDADVILAALTLPYYRAGDAPQRLHSEIMQPARLQGYRSIWLAGASMGGMGTLLYDAAFPGAVDGLVLFAPYLGDTSLLREIRDAGGVARWQPGPPQPVNADTWQRELWRHLQTWTSQPAQAQRVWLTYGDTDRLRDAMPLLERVVPPTQVLRREGGHAWSVWSAAAVDVFHAIDAKSAAKP
ncbi:alpha/beta hydrolase-fold protein [Tahibacter sp.]|uniref:alpha/beta hydrolase-fold protein n=1 Tax=Tahibacter sp. TaxID=2056211 RepID=UPI0028C4BDFC|nr:alpha/beta hydrolase-fold protein [Tahibacter sp.]